MDPNEVHSTKTYAISGRIMLSAIIILFFVVIMMVCLHLYARWRLLNSRRRQLRRARSRRTHLSSTAAPSRGLDSSLLKSLPVFTFNSGSHPDPIECAVCLSEFEENETGRTLPECKHSFHIDCIDMWFHSNSTCPVCRAPVEPVPDNPSRIDPPNVIIGASSSSDMCSTCQRDGQVTVEIPMRSGGFEDESVTESPAAYRSPMRRMLSFRRILSRERRGGGGYGTESDVERGETQQNQG